jgi:hypothetical protein
VADLSLGGKGEMLSAARVTAPAYASDAAVCAVARRSWLGISALMSGMVFIWLRGMIPCFSLCGNWRGEDRLSLPALVIVGEEVVRLVHARSAALCALIM